MKIQDLKESDKGRKVIWTAGSKREEGILTSWNEKYIFVRFKGPKGEACEPRHVEFL